MGFQQVATELAARDMYGALLKNRRSKYRPFSDAYGKEIAQELNEQRMSAMVLFDLPSSGESLLRKQMMNLGGKEN